MIKQYVLTNFFEKKSQEQDEVNEKSGEKENAESVDEDEIIQKEVCNIYYYCKFQLLIIINF